MTCTKCCSRCVPTACTAWRQCRTAFLSLLVIVQAVDHDKDVRVVAMDDLCGELEKDQQLDPAMEKRCVC